MFSVIQCVINLKRKQSRNQPLFTECLMANVLHPLHPTLHVAGQVHFHRSVRPSFPDKTFRFFQMLVQVGHEWRAARAHGGRIARMGLMLAEDVPVGIVDVDLPKL